MSGTTSTRKRTTSSSPSSTKSSSGADNSNYLPPPRQSKVLKSVPLPLQNTSLRKLIYILVILTTLLTAFYSYRLVKYKRDIGGWWNLALGRGRYVGGTAGERAQDAKHSEASSVTTGFSSKGESVEDRINALASALGMPSNELASAIAKAVRNYVPPASLSSVAAKETGTLITEMMGAKEDGETGSKESSKASTTHGVVEGVMSGIENFVGMDEP